MEFKDALRWALYYRILSFVSFLIGFGIIAIGILIGLGETISIITSTAPLTEPDVIERALQAANFPLTVVFVFIGLVVWRVGKAVAFYKTQTEAVKNEVQEESDSSTDGGH